MPLRLRVPKAGFFGPAVAPAAVVSASVAGVLAQSSTLKGAAVRATVGVGASVILVTSLFGATAAAGDDLPTDEIVTAASPAGAAARAAITAAVALLPKTPKIIAVMDITPAKPEVRDRLRRLDAFTVEGNDVVYLVDGSELLRGAQQGLTFHRAALAAVIWHELAHLNGADERAARKAESTLWASFVRDGLIDQVTGLRYLSALERRPDDRLQARADGRGPSERRP